MDCLLFRNASLSRSVCNRSLGQVALLLLKFLVDWLSDQERVWHEREEEGGGGGVEDRRLGPGGV